MKFNRPAVYQMLQNNSVCQENTHSVMAWGLSAIQSQLKTLEVNIAAALEDRFPVAPTVFTSCYKDSSKTYKSMYKVRRDREPQTMGFYVKYYIMESPHDFAVRSQREWSHTQGGIQVLKHMSPWWIVGLKQNLTQTIFRKLGGRETHCASMPLMKCQIFYQCYKLRL